MYFETVKPGPRDPMFDLKKLADGDYYAEKIDLGVGIYRNESCSYQELRSITKAKKILDESNLGHDYELTVGNARFLRHAARLVFGDDSEALTAQRVGSVQTISGTGSCHIAALFLQRCLAPQTPKVYIGTPAWGNYEPLMRLVGLNDINTYRYYSKKDGIIDFNSMLGAIRSAPKHSIFVLQACCHNPTGMDLTKEQWQILAAEIVERKHFPFFDMAYQGLGTTIDDDAWAVRLFAQTGVEMIVCQSFSKNFGLYGERCGALHVVCGSEAVASCVKDQLRSLIRWEFSSSPAYGSRLVSIIFEDDVLRQDWLDELGSMRQRLYTTRLQLYSNLKIQDLPGNWESIKQTKGLFCYLPLSAAQCQTLISKHHIYLPSSGRINISGINASNLEKVVTAIASVVELDGTPVCSQFYDVRL